ncbi:MAG: hypothetical protein AAGD35_01275 [Actinomycetota bacterium]
MSPVPFRLAGPALLAALALSCVDDDPAAEPTGTDDLVVYAQDIDFDRDTYTLPAGSNTIDYVLDGSLPHTLLIEDHTGNVLDLDLNVGGGDDVGTATVTLEPGTFVLFCDVPGHRSAGMDAELIVTPGTDQ